MLKPEIVQFDETVPLQMFANRLQTAINRSPLVITHCENSKSRETGFWDEVSELVGGPCLRFGEDRISGERTGNKWNEVRYDPSFRTGYRYTNEAQPLHTDGSYFSEGPDVVFFFCINQAKIGGETIFVDPVDLLNVLETNDPGFLKALFETPVKFSKAKDSKERPILSIDKKGICVTWNYFCLDANAPTSVRNLVQKFHRFLEETFVKKQLYTSVKLLPGEAVFFHDERLLHGRNAFDASEPDERYFLKSAFYLQKMKTQ